LKRILIVDDRKEIRELVDVTLRSEDYQIFQAASGEEAIFIAKAEKPDLIIMDVMMPSGINGFEATSIIKNDPDIKNCKILILSSKGQLIDVEEGRKAGADEYFIKPFSPLDLIKKVEELLG